MDDIISVVYLDLTRDNPKIIVDEILETYIKLSKISGLKNNEMKTIYSEDIRMEMLSLYLIDEHEADRGNIRFKGDEIKLLGDTLALGIDEAGDKDGYVSSGISERFLKIKAKTLKW